MLGRCGRPVVVAAGVTGAGLRGWRFTVPAEGLR
jgi:hypothetical protein